jgi:hypothetical protein
MPDMPMVATPHTWRSNIETVLNASVAMQDCDPGNTNPVVHDGDPIKANAKLVIHCQHPKSMIMARSLEPMSTFLPSTP